MFVLHLFSASCGTPFFLRWRALTAVLAFSLLASGSGVASDISPVPLLTGDFATAREAVLEAIEADGLVVSAVLPFGQLLARTASDLGKPASPLRQAEIIQFCSARLAWALIEEDPAQLVFCPLSLALYERAEAPGQVFLAFHTPAVSGAARRQLVELLQKIAGQAQALSRYR